MKGEMLAARFLRSRGYRILHKNLRTPFGEIDIIAERARTLVFVEVKTRLSERFGTPQESITRVKRRHILDNCRYFLKNRAAGDPRCRIDVITVEIDPSYGFRLLRHIKNAIRSP